MNRERDKKHKTEQRRVRNVKQKDGNEVLKGNVALFYEGVD